MKQLFTLEPEEIINEVIGYDLKHIYEVIFDIDEGFNFKKEISINEFEDVEYKDLSIEEKNEVDLALDYFWENNTFLNKEKTHSFIYTGRPTQLIYIELPIKKIVSRRLEHYLE